MEEINDLKQRIKGLEEQLADAQSKALQWEKRADALEHPTQSQSSQSNFTPSQSTNTKEFDIDSQFYRRIYIIGLRKYVKGATVIPAVLHLCASFFSDIGYDMHGVDRFIPSASTCAVYCHSLSKFVSNVHVSIELFTGHFKNKYLSQFRDGSSFKGLKIETFGV
eukprot:896336_1